MPTPTPTTTGPGSTSFAVWLVTFLGGVASAVEGIVTPGSAAHTATYGGVGALVALGSTIGKLVHDRGLHVATIQAAGAEFGLELPKLRSDLSTAVGFAENDVPQLKSVVSSVTDRVGALETKVVPVATTDVAAVTNIVHGILSGLAQPPVALVAPVPVAPVAVTPPA